MSSVLWPPSPSSPAELVADEEACLASELHWLLDSLRETLLSLKAGLEECAVLLSPDGGAHTLVLSSLRSESIKGFVTRVGTRVVKGDVNVKPSTTRPPPGMSSYRLSISSAPDAPALTLPQLVSARGLINDSLDVIDVSTWAGDASDASFMAGQLRLLFDRVNEAKQALKGGGPGGGRPWWWEDPVDVKAFQPECPGNISFHLFIADAALVLQVRTLEPAAAPPHADSLSGFGLRDRLAIAFGGSKTHIHEEIGDTFSYRGAEVRVREMMRVESQDPSLLAAMAKLSALEHSVAMSRKALDTVMGVVED